MPFRRQTALTNTTGLTKATRLPKATRIGLACMALAGLLGQAARAEDVRATYAAQAGYALHLMEAGRYGEAADAAQALVSARPDAALPYALRGACALYVGSADRARADFDRAAGASGDPVLRYGQALALLTRRETAQARAALADAAKGPGLTPAQAGDVETLRAYGQLLDGDAAGAETILGKPAAEGAADGPSDSARAEVAAMAAFRADPKAGLGRLTKFLETPTGVPRVREEDGLRLGFDPRLPLEPSVTDPELQAMYADRIKGGLRDAAQRTGTVRACAGRTALAPAETLPAQTALVSYSVDGQMAAMVGAPYTFVWDSRRVANGTHTVRIDAADANGNPLLSQTQTVRVANLGGDAADAGAADPATAALESRLWNLLRPRPARKVAEWSLAQADLAAGDRVGADAHFANAAALDPSYKDGRRFARALFGSTSETVAGRVASAQPVVLWTGSGAGHQVALTFDDGPNPAKTPALLDALDRAGAPATFFVVGSRAEAAPDLLRRMARRGDDVENHSFTHPNMNLVVGSTAEAELLRTSVLIRALTGRHPRFFRPPGGNADPAVQRLARAYGLTLAYWTVDAIHAEDTGSAPELIRYVLAHVHPGSIVLLHNAPDVTTAAVPGLVAALRARGYVLVTLSRLARPAGGGRPGAAAKMPKMKE